MPFFKNVNMFLFFAFFCYNILIDFVFLLGKLLLRVQGRGVPSGRAELQEDQHRHLHGERSLGLRKPQVRHLTKRQILARGGCSLLTAFFHMDNIFFYV